MYDLSICWSKWFNHANAPVSVILQSTAGFAESWLGELSVMEFIGRLAWQHVTVTLCSVHTYLYIEITHAEYILNQHTLWWLVPERRANTSPTHSLVQHVKHLLRVIKQAYSQEKAWSIIAGKLQVECLECNSKDVLSANATGLLWWWLMYTCTTLTCFLQLVPKIFYLRCRLIAFLD